VGTTDLYVRHVLLPPSRPLCVLLRLVVLQSVLLRSVLLQSVRPRLVLLRSVLLRSVRPRLVLLRSVLLRSVLPRPVSLRPRRESRRSRRGVAAGAGSAPHPEP